MPAETRSPPPIPTSSTIPTSAPPCAPAPGSKARAPFPSPKFSFPPPCKAQTATASHPAGHPAGRLAIRKWAREIATNTRLTTTYAYTSGIFTGTTYAYNPTTLALTSETVSYDLNADGTPNFTRVLNRTQDNLLRPTGYTLQGSAGVPPAIEAQATYQYSPTEGRLQTVADASSGSFTYSYLPNSSLISTVTGPVHTVENTYVADRNVPCCLINRAHRKLPD